MQKVWDRYLLPQSSTVNVPEGRIPEIRDPGFWISGNWEFGDRAHEFDLWFGIQGRNEILEARNDPETGKCVFLVPGPNVYFSFP